MGKFHNKDGTLTRYALACGYIEHHETATPNIITRMYLDGTFHITQYNHTTHERLAWEVTESLKAARKEYRARVREAKRIVKEAQS